MKLNVQLKSFGAGVIACATLFAIYSFTDKAPLLEQEGDVTAQQAKALHQAYLQSEPPAVDGPVQAIEVSASTLSIMSDVVKSNSGANGVRVYLGLDTNGDVANVVIATQDGKDMISGAMRLSAGEASSCPNVCDMASPIMR